MGQHVYFVEIMKKSGLFPKPKELYFSSLRGDVTQDASRIGRFSNGLHYLDTKSCREYVVSLLSSKESSLTSPEIGNNYLLGIRCFGAQHTSVAKVLCSSEVDYARIFSDFVKKVLGLHITIDAGRVKSTSFHEFPTGTARKVGLLHEKDDIDNDGYISIHIRSWKNRSKRNLPTKVSAIIWLLREPLLCEYILSGKITDGLSLAKYVLELSAKRSTGEDESYMPLAIYAPGYTRFLAVKSLKESQMQALNGNGFDYLSTFYMAVYFTGMHKGWLKNCRANFSNNGPVSIARNEISDFRRKQCSEILSDYRRDMEKFLAKLIQRLNSAPEREFAGYCQRALDAKKAE